MKVKVYGFNHSPWVQAVLLALHDKGIKYNLLQIPPSKVFNKWGVYMPAVSIDDEPWEIESTKILVKLGYKNILEEEIKAAQNAWQGVLHRTDNPFRFFSAFSRGGQSSKSFVNNAISNFLLSFIAFYMFTLISIGKWRLKQKEPKNFGDQFLYWEKILRTSKGDFLDGDEPGTRDMVMFGMIQCHASIPVPALEAMLHDERLHQLRIWISTMQERFREYPYLYSTRFFEPKVSQIKPASSFQRIVFFFGLLAMFLTIPISVPLVLTLMSRVEPARIKSF